MNKQQRTLLLVFIAVVVFLMAAILFVNLSRRAQTAPDPVFQSTAAPTAELPELSGKTEEEIAAMAMQEEEGGDFVSAFDDDPLVETLDPNATPEPID